MIITLQNRIYLYLQAIGPNMRINYTNRERVCHSEPKSKKAEAESLRLQLACFVWKAVRLWLKLIRFTAVQMS